MKYTAKQRDLILEHLDKLLDGSHIAFKRGSTRYDCGFCGAFWDDMNKDHECQKCPLAWKDFSGEWETQCTGKSHYLQDDDGFAVDDYDECPTPESVRRRVEWLIERTNDHCSNYEFYLEEVEDENSRKA